MPCFIIIFAALSLTGKYVWTPARPVQSQKVYNHLLLKELYEKKYCLTHRRLFKGIRNIC